MPPACLPGTGGGARRRAPHPSCPLALGEAKLEFGLRDEAIAHLRLAVSQVRAATLRTWRVDRAEAALLRKAESGG